jgi:hypothetical protein
MHAVTVPDETSLLLSVERPLPQVLTAPNSWTTALLATTALSLLALTACSGGADVSDAEPAETISFGIGIEGVPSDDPYWDECPDMPVFHRNLDFVSRKAGRATPEAAVATVSDASITEVRPSGAAAVEVMVRLGDDSGMFFVQKRHSAWFVEGGEGCAAWPAAQKVTGS